MIRLLPLLLLPATLGAQTPDCAPGDPGATRPHPVVLAASLPLTSLFSSYPEEWRLHVLDRWRARFVPPTDWQGAVPRDVWVPAPSSIEMVAAPFVAAGQYAARFRRDGRLDRVEVERASGAPGLDSAVLAAFRALDREGGIGTLPEDILRSRAEWRVLVGAAHPPGSTIVPLVADTAHWAEASTPAKVLRRPAARFTSLSASQAGGGSAIEYIVEATGKVRPGSERILWSSSRDIGKALLRAVRSAEYRPATVDGCPVASVVHWQQLLGGGPYDPTTTPAPGARLP